MTSKHTNVLFDGLFEFPGFLGVPSCCLLKIVQGKPSTALEGEAFLMMLHHEDQIFVVPR